MFSTTVRCLPILPLQTTCGVQMIVINHCFQCRNLLLDEFNCMPSKKLSAESYIVKIISILHIFSFSNNLKGFVICKSVANRYLYLSVSLTLSVSLVIGVKLVKFVNTLVLSHPSQKMQVLMQVDK